MANESNIPREVLYGDKGMSSEVVTSQPQSFSAVPGESGPVIIKIMTKDDVQFVAAMSVEAFRDKMAHAVGEENLDHLKDITARAILLSPQWVYERNFVAFYNGERAGVCVLKYHGDKEPDIPSENFQDVGCCMGMRLGCFECVLNEKVPANTVYVDHICVDSAFRGKGVGKVLLDRADYEARQRNAREIYLMVTHTNRAQNLYTRQGYQIVGSEWFCCGSCLMGVSNFYKMSKPL